MTPQQMSQSSFNMGRGEPASNNQAAKMPIPRTLNVTAPVPVSMGQARPTMGGPTNGAPGMLGQPVMTKWPQFQLEGEGDRVLSKRKLDELVRQVTGGGGDGPGGEALTPEVEEVSTLSLNIIFLLSLLS
jgi:transcription initiation factor TFIID subunit 12